MIFEHNRFEIWNATQHPYKHNVSEFAYTNSALPGVSNIEGAMDYIIGVLYPNQKTAVANVAALPLAGNTIYDFRVVLDDGDGKSAGYRWEQREGDASAKWYKIYDMDFGAGSVLSAAMENAQDLFVQKFGNDDRDSTGTAITGTYAGQTIFGGKSASTNLTLKANAGDGTGSQTGYIQFGDQVRPDANNTIDLGTASNQFKNAYLAGTLNASVAVLGTGSSSTPSIGFSGHTTTGLYYSATNRVRFISGGTDVLDIFDSTGPNLTLRIASAGTSSIYQAAGDGSMISSGGSSATSGRNTVRYGGSHATLANYFQLRRGTTVDGQIDGSGAWTIGDSGSTQTHTVNGQITTTLSSTSAAALTISNTNNSANTAHSVLQATVGGASGGNPLTKYVITGATTWGVGADNADSDKYKISSGGSLGTNDYFTISTSGLVTLGGSGGSQTHVVNGSLSISTKLSNSSFSTSSMVKFDGNTLTGTSQYAVEAATFTGTSAATSSIVSFMSGATTAAASFTSGLVAQFYADNIALGAGSTATRRIGYYVNPQTSGTNNANFSDNTSFSGDYSLSLTSSRQSRIGGRVAIGGSDDTSSVLNVGVGGSTVTMTGTSQSTVSADSQIGSDATASAQGVLARIRTPNSSFTCGIGASFWSQTASKGASSTVTRLIHFYANGAQTAGTNNATIADNSSFTGNWGVNFTASTQNKLTGPFFVPSHNTTANAANAYLDSATGELMRSTSSLRYKTNVMNLQIDTSKLHDLRPVEFDDKATGNRHFGLIAEEVHEVLPELVEYASAKSVLPGSDEERIIPESVKYSMLSVLLLKEIQRMGRLGKTPIRSSKKDQEKVQIENFDELPSFSPRTIGRLVYNTKSEKIFCDAGWGFKQLSVDKFIRDIPLSGEEQTITVDLREEAIDDARKTIWQLCHLENEMERVVCSIKTPNEKTVVISSKDPLPAGTYRLIGIE